MGTIHRDLQSEGYWNCGADIPPNVELGLVGVNGAGFRQTVVKMGRPTFLVHPHSPLYNPLTYTVLYEHYLDNGFNGVSPAFEPGLRVSCYKCGRA